MPELAELRAFCAAVDLGSLGKAARLLRVSQPALSKRLRVLEAVTGSQLLERSPRGVTPTAAGEKLYAAARRLLAEAEVVETLMEGLGADQAPVRLAVSPTIAEFVLPAMLVELESRHDRHLSIELSIANSSTTREMVLEGRSDIGVGVADGSESGAAGVCESPFCTDEVVVAVPEGHTWAAVEAIDPAEFVETRMIMRDPGASSRRAVSGALEAAGMSLAPPLAEIGSTSTAIATAVSEGAPALLSSLALSSATAQGLLVRRVAGLRFERSFAVIHSSEESLSSAARSLARHLLEARPPRS